jgi:uncharacterized protein DUF4397
MRGTTMRTVRTTIAVLLCGLVAAMAAPVPAGAAQQGAYLRLAHLSPDTPRVDVTVSAFGAPSDSEQLDGVGYGDVSAYRRIDTGTYTIAMRPAGADEKSDPVISATLDAVAGRAYTVAGLGPFDDLALRVLDDDISLPPAGTSRMRVVNAAPLAGDLAIRRDGTAVIERASFGDATAYAVVPAGTSTLTVAPFDGAATELPVDLTAGSVYTVLVLQRDGKLSAALRQDAKGAEVVPDGGVETGLGGTAGDPGGTAVWSLALLAAVVMVVTVVVVGAVLPRRRRVA